MALSADLAGADYSLLIVMEASTVQLVSIWLANRVFGCAGSCDTGNVAGGTGDRIYSSLRCLSGFLPGPL